MVWLGLLVHNAEDKSNPHFLSWVLLDCLLWIKFLGKSFIPLRISFISCCCCLPVSLLGYQQEDWHMWFAATSASVPLSVLRFQQCGAWQQQHIPPLDEMASLTVHTGLSSNCCYGAFTRTYFRSHSIYTNLNISVKDYADSCGNYLFPFSPRSVAAAPVALTSETQAGSRVQSCVAAVVGPAEVGLQQQFSSTGAARACKRNALFSPE